jgi:hypothetical protein
MGKAWFGFHNYDLHALYLQKKSVKWHKIWQFQSKNKSTCFWGVSLRVTVLKQRKKLI